MIITNLTAINNIFHLYCHNHKVFRSDSLTRFNFINRYQEDSKKKKEEATSQTINHIHAISKVKFQI